MPPCCDQQGVSVEEEVYDAALPQHNLLYDGEVGGAEVDPGEEGSASQRRGSKLPGSASPKSQR